MPNSPLGIHAGVWGFDWSPAGAARAIGGAADAGYDLIEIPAPRLGARDSATTRALLERHSIAPAVSLALGVDDDISSPDASCRESGTARLLDAVEFAVGIGASFLGGVIYSAMARPDRSRSQAGRGHSLAALRQVSAAAARRGVTLGVEYVNRYESNLLNTAAETLDFIEELGADNVVLHLDTFHAHIEEVDIAAAIDLAGDRLGYLHASESHRGALGSGSLDWPRIVRALAGVGYRGPITVETFSSAVLDDDEAVGIGLWRPLWSDPTELAHESIAFLREQLSLVS